MKISQVSNIIFIERTLELKGWQKHNFHVTFPVNWKLVVGLHNWIEHQLHFCYLHELSIYTAMCNAANASKNGELNKQSTHNKNTPLVDAVSLLLLACTQVVLAGSTIIYTCMCTEDI